MSPPETPNSAYDRYSRPRTGSIERKSLSRKLQAKKPPPKFKHCELAATLMGWLQLSDADEPVQVTLHAAMAMYERLSGGIAPENIGLYRLLM